MTNPEFSSEFDILYNNITSNAAPGLNEYEKSVFLTQAQESIILEIYDGRFNDDSFESTEEVTSYINSLVKQARLTTPMQQQGISEHSVFYQLPEDLWFITYESARLQDDRLGCKNGYEVIVRPITQDTYNRVSKNPFRGYGENRVLRLTMNNLSELISKFNIESYFIRYISKPEPIILEDLSDYGVSIDNKTQVTECKLNPAIHRTILNRAVKLAKAVWTSGV